MKRVLDAHALMIFLEKEKGYEKVESCFLQAVDKDENLLMASVNYGEVYYIVLRECGHKKAEEVEKTISNLPIEIVSVDASLAQEAGKLKAFHKMSYADCFAAALAKQHHAEVLTGDPEFHQVEKQIKISWV